MCIRSHGILWGRFYGVKARNGVAGRLHVRTSTKETKRGEMKTRGQVSEVNIFMRFLSCPPQMAITTLKGFRWPLLNCRA